jgi:arsenite methyltransferase
MRVRAIVFHAVAIASLMLAAVPARAQLAPRTAEEWLNTLETPARLNSLKIAETVKALNLKPGQMLADIGAGTGIFSRRLANAVKPGGWVYAVDIDQALLDHIAEAATEEGIGNIQPVLGQFDDPALPDNVDLAFINDVLHHIEHRDVYLKNLAGYLKPGGRVALIEFKPGQGGHTNDTSLQISQEQATAWMTAAGLKQLEVIDLFPDKYFVIFGK